PEALSPAVDLRGRIAERAKDPVVQPGRAELREEVWAHVLPHDLALTRHLEDASVAPLADERIVVCQPLRARNVGTEKFEQRLISVLPDDRTCAGIHLDHARERDRVIRTVRAIVEYKEVASGQRPRIMLLGKRWAAELPDDLPRRSFDHHDG